MLIGGHVSQAGGLARAVQRGTERGCRAIQIFNQSPRMWRPTAYGPEDFDAFRRVREASAIEAVLIHAVYLLNCASEDPSIVTRTHASLVQSLRVGSEIEACGVVLHPGSALKSDPGQAISRAGEVIARALAESELNGAGEPFPDGGCALHLENTAGAGGTLGRSFEELAELISAAGGGRRLRVCLDSCHLYASGYDIRTADGLHEVLDAFDGIVGIERLGSLHLNDSAVGLGSNRDRHANLGEGELGEDGCAVFLSEPRFEGLPCVMEIPGRDREGLAAEDVTQARELRERGHAARE